MAGKTATAEVPEVVERALGEGTFSVETFVESFPALVEAGSGIHDLKEMVLTMAFSGQLVPRDADTSAVEETLAQIEEAWRKRQRREALPPVSSEETPISPTHWAWLRLGNIAGVIGGVTKGRDLKGRKRISLPYLRVANVQRGFLDLSEMKEIEIAEDELPKYQLKSGDVLFTEGGDWDKLGRSAVWGAQIKSCIHQNHVFRARLISPQLDPAWFSAFANSPLGRNYFQNAAKRTTNLASINMTQLRNCPMPLPPLAEQKRIVARVDQLMALIDQLEAKQNRKRDLGARFTKASLEALTTAESPQSLTTAWTRLQFNWPTVLDLPDEVDGIRTAILSVAIQGRLSAKGRHETHDKNTPALPFGWQFKTVEEVGEVKLGRQRAPKNHNGPNMRPYLRVANVYEGRIDTSDVLQMNFEAEEVKRFLLKENDVLLNEGQSYELIGRPALYRGEVPGACFQNTLIRFRPGDLVMPDFALIVFRAYMRNGRFRQEAQQTTNIAHLSAGRLATIEFPLPPLAEQKRIVAKVEHLMKLCDALEAALRRREDRAAKLAEAVVQEMVA